jgi:hypothetical protein
MLSKSPQVTVRFAAMERVVSFIVRTVGYASLLVFILGITWVGIIMLGALPDWSLPALLRNLSATGGYTDACPVPKFLETVIPLIAPAEAPEFNARLARLFPAGANESDVVLKLRAMGFQMIGPCKDDPTIRRARFDQRRFGPYLFPLFAGVFWKVDEAGKLEWTRGVIAHTGP